MLKGIETGIKLSDFEIAVKIVETSNLGAQLPSEAQSFVAETFIELLNQARRITGSERLNGQSLIQSLSVDDDIQEGVDVFDKAKKKTANILAARYGLLPQGLNISLQAYFQDCYTVIVGYGGNIERFLGPRNPRRDTTGSWLESLENGPKKYGSKDPLPVDVGGEVS